MTLGASSGYLPLVTLSGRVGSDTPIIGEQSGLEAVSQIFLKKQKDAKEYVVVRGRRMKMDDGTGRFEVVRAHNADGSVLRLASDDFETQPRTCGCECSIRILGLRRTEWTLPTGTNLTVVGEAVKGDSGNCTPKLTLQVRKPQQVD
ncbi:E3 ubiquitin-protein ligase SP1-like [Panicum virgatum]|uniref:E3 ubiquitin-protein ligase SP1-like n=1 Tax=Panicum virgatum TaxID=38727 RepID=UPI0019D5C643|nr:E3 ubiquitin-protein ligase SP1-like [Panicum virgatum]